ncbi:MAG: hypothetical protein US11_C0004G0017 [Candidatus Roizmanbacteria bacterium GW2011_GWA2_36_23]|uniref:Uncharacterized protein n=1 Tax=Candidatus Roizmanbacteria bacterium GW2011_GWA2_36_23 TaxID=1618480 RepID=A0A0G0E8A6_9BACT|nr:MAG: hypothetical protein US11_C0004G0017 [Candidatus Roizmanbacteria bacterium GW2011_GWA2_36_23]
MYKIFAVLISGLLLAGVVVAVFSQKQKSMFSPKTTKILPTETKTISGVKLKTFSSTSGFSFQYPEQMEVKTKKFKDQSIYDWVELTFPGKKGVISVKLENSDLDEIDDWFTKERKSSISGKTENIKIGDVEGRQYLANNQKVSLGLDQDNVLTSITTNPESDKDIFFKAHEKIVSSFVFILPSRAESNLDQYSSSGGEEDVIFEGEEIIE